MPARTQGLLAIKGYATHQEGNEILQRELRVRTPADSEIRPEMIHICTESVYLGRTQVLKIGDLHLTVRSHTPLPVRCIYPWIATVIQGQIDGIEGVGYVYTHTPLSPCWETRTVCVCMAWLTGWGV